MAKRDLPKDYRGLSIDEARRDMEERRTLSEAIEQIDKHCLVCAELVSNFEPDYLLTNTQTGERHLIPSIIKVEE